MQDLSRGAAVAPYAIAFSQSKRTDFESLRPCLRPAVALGWQLVWGDPRQMRSLGVVALVAALGGCSTTPADLEAKAVPIIQTYSENYQEIYRRVSTTAKRCFAGNVGAYASFAVDSELYSELGYGELTLSLINMGTRNYYLSIRVEKQPAGSKLTVRSGNTLASERYKSLVLGWAGLTAIKIAPLFDGVPDLTPGMKRAHYVPEPFPG
jgi:hypothetical protein